MEIYSFIGSDFEEKPKKENRFIIICKKIWNNKLMLIGLLSTYVLVMVLMIVRYNKVLLVILSVINQLL